MIEQTRMTPAYTTEYYTALECKDLQANAMTIDSTGSLVLLAGRRYLAIRNLDDEYEALQKVSRQSKYDVGAAEWNQTHFNRDLCVISSNQRLEVFVCRGEDLTQSCSLRAHTRVITDLNWHKFDPNLIASCSVDTFIHIWDLRDSKRPTLSLSAVAEATQVKWNKISSHLLASAHDGDIKVWDQRKGTAPVQYLSAHLSKIHGLDWNPTSENLICSSSQDSTVKFFDITNPRRSDFVLTTNAPVWRARHTPFGNGLVTAVVPQLRRAEHSLILWNTVTKASSLHTFIGHRDVVLDFEWRKQKSNEVDFHLVTWSRDQTLLVWKIDPFIQKFCGYEAESKDDDLSFEFSDDRFLLSHSPKAQPLQQEFSLLNVHIPNLSVEKMDPVARNVLVKVTINSFIVHLQVTFPNAYPLGVPPVFQVSSGSNINDNITIQLLQMLKHLAHQRVSKNRTCLEACLRQMVTTLEQLSSGAESNRMYDRSYLEPGNVFAGYNDSYIPYPKTSGAKFCSVGTLICFSRTVLARRPSSRLDTSSVLSTTPRALSALENHFERAANDYMTVSTYYYQRQRSRSKHNFSKVPRAMVYIYDALGLFFVNKQLAEEYILDGDVGTICKHNAASAAVVGRWDLVQAWTLAELVAGAQQSDEEMFWSLHPLGNKLMKSLIEHYARQYDFQMAAMLCCIFGKDYEILNRKASIKSLLSPVSGGSPYHTILPADVITDGWVIPILRTARSTSLDSLRVEEVVEAAPMVQNTLCPLHEYYKLNYAETLYRWGLIYNKTEVLKYMTKKQTNHKGVEFLSECKNCTKIAKHASCSCCKKLTLRCVICHISVKGSSNCCAICGHGGHTRCMMKWFKIKDICITGCGCHCLMEYPSVFNP